MSDQQTRSRRRAGRGRTPSPETPAEPAVGGSAARRPPPVVPPQAMDAVDSADAVDSVGAVDSAQVTHGAGTTEADAALDAARGADIGPAAAAAAAQAVGDGAQATRRSRESGSDGREIPWHLRPWSDEDGQAAWARQAPVASDGSNGGPDGGPDGGGHRHPSWPPEVQPHHHAWVYAIAALFLLSLAFGAWGLWTVFRPIESLGGDLRAQNERYKQEVSTLRRSDQISREANRDLQRTLAERDEEIAGLRADVAFYERFVGATGQRRGLSVHELKLQPERDDAWRFVATLTQNLNRGAINSGRLTVSVEGTRDGRLQRLAWSELRQQTAEPGLDYSFKYFQQVEGNLILPAGFEPLRLTVRLVPEGGSAVEQSFPWADVAAAPRAPEAGLR